MRRKSEPESDELRELRARTELRDRRRNEAAEDNALDAAVRRSIKAHGP